MTPDEIQAYRAQRMDEFFSKTSPFDVEYYRKLYPDRDHIDFTDPKTGRVTRLFLKSQEVKREVKLLPLPMWTPITKGLIKKMYEDAGLPVPDFPPEALVAANDALQSFKTEHGRAPKPKEGGFAKLLSNVIGMSESKARAALSSFRVIVDGESGPWMVVVAQNPSAGTKLHWGDEVTITLGPSKAALAGRRRMPDVMHMSQDAAHDALSEFTVLVMGDKDSPTAEVVAQSPRAGTLVTGVVKITVKEKETAPGPGGPSPGAMGPEGEGGDAGGAPPGEEETEPVVPGGAASTSIVPNVVGMRIDEARAALQDVGFEDWVFPKADEQGGSAKVASQLPAAGVAYELGWTVRLSLGKAPGGGRVAPPDEEETEPVVPGSTGSTSIVPHVVGMSIDEARAALQDAGFEDWVFPKADEQGGRAKVATQLPAAGVAYELGWTVRLSLEKAPGASGALGNFPNVVGDLYGDAKRKIDAAGLYIAFDPKTPLELFGMPLVKKQFPTAEEPILRPGRTIWLTLIEAMPGAGVPRMPGAPPGPGPGGGAPAKPAKEEPVKMPTVEVTCPQRHGIVVDLKKVVASIPPGVDIPLHVSISGLERDDSVLFDIVAKGAPGYVPVGGGGFWGSATIVGKSELTESGTIAVRGGGQTDQSMKGRLQVRAWLKRPKKEPIEIGQAVPCGFSVCAHPAHFSVVSRTPYSMPDGSGMIALNEWGSDAKSRNGALLDHAKKKELIGVVSSPFPIGQGDKELDYMNAKPPTYQDPHLLNPSLLRAPENGTHVVHQMFVFSCERCGANDVAAEESGFEIVYTVTKEPNGRQWLNVRKHGKAATMSVKKRDGKTYNYSTTAGAGDVHVDKVAVHG